jgi:hypothetical protein
VGLNFLENREKTLAIVGGITQIVVVVKKSPKQKSLP